MHTNEMFNNRKKGGGREGGREGVMEGGRKGGREGGKEGGREGGREGGWMKGGGRLMGGWIDWYLLFVLLSLQP